LFGFAVHGVGFCMCVCMERMVPRIHHRPEKNIAQRRKGMLLGKMMGRTTYNTDDDGW
jgi:hypothetical protein